MICPSLGFLALSVVQAGLRNSVTSQSSRELHSLYHRGRAVACDEILPDPVTDDGQPVAPSAVTNPLVRVAEFFPAPLSD